MTELKRRPRRPRAAPEPVQEEVDAPTQEVDATPPPEPLYRTGRWHGHPNYECARCEFRTLKRALIEKHVALAHPAGGR